MYKVLIVDDEEPSREAVRLLGDWESLQVTEVLEADNGNSGLSLLRQHRPDLVLVDMKMPEMDGPAFLQAAVREFPDVFFIVVSGYDDFAYMQQAIRTGAIDYLLKPINRQELGQTLARAMARLEEKRRRESEALDRNIALNLSLPRLKEKIFWSYVEGSSSRPAGVVPSGLIGTDEANRAFGLALIRLMNGETVCRNRFGGDADLFAFALGNVVQELGAGKINCFGFRSPKTEREFLVVFMGDADAGERMDRYAVSCMRRVAEQLHALFGLVTVSAVGESDGSAEGLSEAYRTARQFIGNVDLLALDGLPVLVPGKASSPVFPKGGGDVGSAGAAARNGPEPSITARMGMIRHALEEGNLNYACGILKDFLGVVRQSGRFSLGSADRMLQEFILLLHEMALDLGVPNEELVRGCEASLRDKGIPFDYVHFASYGRLLEQVLLDFGEKIQSSLRRSPHFDIHDIKAYIDNHYYEDIKIFMFTEKYYLSREYLMRRFKQEFGCGIYEYVQKVRMEKARSLLEDPNLKIQDIADMLGYKDKNYFSKAFKNYYGQSPSEYRHAIRAK